mgnify:CR=1 FL=1
MCSLDDVIGALARLEEINEVAAYFAQPLRRRT